MPRAKSPDGSEISGTSESSTRPSSPHPDATATSHDASSLAGPAAARTAPGPEVAVAARKTWYDEVPATEDANSLRQSFANFQQNVLAISVSRREEEMRTSTAGGAEPHTSLLPASRVAEDPHDLPREQQDAFNLRRMGLLQRTRIRVPALVVTLLVELVVAFVISDYADSGIFRRYPLLIAFQPVISAISGNVGLQSASINVRELAVGLTAGSESVFSGIRRETQTGGLLGLTMGIVLGAIAFVWYAPVVPGNDVHTWGGALVFGLSICIGQIISAWCAATSGSAAPLIFTKCGLDPTTVAGPMETAVQDVLGSSLLLALSAALLEEFGDYGSACPGGDLAGCVAKCRHANASLSSWEGGVEQPSALFATDCLDTCVRLAADSIC